MEPSFTTRAESSGNSVVVHVTGEVDLTNAGRLRDDMSQLLGRAPNVVLDLTEVAFIDSAGLGALLATRRAIFEQGGSLAIRSSRPVRQVLEVTGLAGLFVEAAQDARL
ncbi:MAG: anti-sigma factor antagonist [Actinomycetota bacterium]|jgi:anti-sigma B factor antagonist|nr:anti-sigma factor antagonist [Actinomycetota bacterium]